MLEQILALFRDSDLLLKVSGIVIGVNVVLSSVSSVLDYFKDKTKTDVDNKASALVHKALDFLKKVVDWASANKKH